MNMTRVLCDSLLLKGPLGIMDGGQISLPRSVGGKREPCGGFFAKITVEIKLYASR